jgi:hypothetical protein
MSSSSSTASCALTRAAIMVLTVGGEDTSHTERHAMANAGDLL